MKRLRLKNFRGFKDTGDIEIRPLTLLIGANSSGKSSFLRFFPLLAQTYRTRTDSPLLWYGDLVDFGDYGEAVHKGDRSQRISMEMSFDVIGHAEGEDFSDELRLVLSLAEREGRTERVAYHLEFVGHQVVIRGAGEEGPIALCGSEPMTGPAGVFFDMGRLGLVPQLMSRPNRLDAEGDASAIQARSSTGGDRAAGAVQQSSHWAAIQECVTLLRSDVAALMAGCGYLGPIRAAPQRFYRSQELALDRVGTAGENLAMYLRSWSSSRLRDFGDFCQEYIGYEVRLHQEGSHVSLKLKDPLTRVETNLVDMGYGFSQVLPVLAELWAITKARSDTRPRGRPRLGAQGVLTAIEQPEVHLHPALQSRLGDVFAAVLASGRRGPPQGRDFPPRGAVVQPPVTLLVETHSEALVNRVGELVELGRIPQRDVTVLLFERDAQSNVCTVRQTFYDERGILKDWPVGFLAG